MIYPSEEIPVCELCILDEVAGAQNVKDCEKCGVRYCAHFASATDFRYCGNCMDDFQVIETVEVKVTEKIGPNGEVIHRKRQLARNLKLTGTDWLFTLNKISYMSDEEITASIEYHNEIKAQMLQERETRRTEFLNKLSKVRINYTKRDDVDSTGAIKAVKVKTPKKKPDENVIAAAFATLLGASMTPAQIEEMMKKLGAK